jgi:hypothetical protein
MIPTNTDTRKAGIALILGTVGDIVTMAIHPMGSGSLTAAQMNHLALASAIAHSLAIASLVPLFLGAIGLTLRLNSFEERRANSDRLALAALVTFALALVAILTAAAVSGFITPTIIRKMTEDNAANAMQWQMIIRAVFQFNQTFAQIYSVAASLAIVLWSASILRNGGLVRRIALYGCMLPPLLIVLIAAGHIRLNVHGMAAVVLVHAVWFIGVGMQLYKHADAVPTSKVEREL